MATVIVQITHTHTHRAKLKYMREIGKEGLQTERMEEVEDDESTLGLTTCQMNVSATSHLPLFFPLPCTVTCDGQFTTALSFNNLMLKTY